MNNHWTGLRRTLLLLGGALYAILGYIACSYYPDSSQRFDDDVVFTGFAAETDFAAYSSFAIDPVMHVAMVEADESVEMSTADSDVSQEITEHVVMNLAARGFREVTPEGQPDLGVKVTAIRGLTTGSVSGGYWWGSYSSYWGYPGWSYYYPYEVQYSYRPGTLVVDVVDLTRARVDASARDGAAESGGEVGGLSVIWTMVGYRAYIDDDVGSQVADAKTAIDQAFEQSPYLARQ